jgi:hypothetical protein
MVSPAARPVGVTNDSVWFATVKGAESERVLLNDMTLAASALKRGAPTNQSVIAKVRTTERAWSKDNELLFVRVMLYVGISFSA